MSYYDAKEVDFSELVGKTLKSVNKIDDDEMVFELEDGTKYNMYHEQDCCESVVIDDINGNLDDLIGSPITLAEERTNSSRDGEYGDSSTWTFYSIATAKGYVDIKWHGQSNGYYSESVSFKKL